MVRGVRWGARDLVDSARVVTATGDCDDNHCFEFCVLCLDIKNGVLGGMEVIGSGGMMIWCMIF